MRIFVFLYMCTGAQWGILAAVATARGDMAILRVPLWLLITGICAAGTSSLAFLRFVRIGYPTILIVPNLFSLLIHPDRENRFVLVASLLFLIYIQHAARVLYSDYWAAALAQWELEKRSLRFEQLSNIDQLTQISNRRRFEEQYKIEWDRACRFGLCVSLMIVDVDHFKRVNDSYGHDTGDRCLKAIADALRAGLHRPTDMVARHGGEEFVIQLPDTGREGAMEVAERLRKAICSIEIWEGNQQIPLTASFGVCTVFPKLGQSPGAAIRSADQAVYRAKEAGRNCVFFFE